LISQKKEGFRDQSFARIMDELTHIKVKKSTEKGNTFQ
jgi:hypothetical protein